MRVDAFDFDLPREQIATRPVSPRHSARLLDVAPDGLHDRIMLDLPGLLEPGDVMVFNDTRVIPARLSGLRPAIQPGGQPASVDITLHQCLGPDTWAAFAKGARKLSPGQTVVLSADGDFTARVEDRQEGGEIVLRFDRSGADLMAALEHHGHIPLPPYMGRKDDARDRQDYQTVYASRDGAVAAPTAGLHFTPELLEAIDGRGIRRVHVTLHVGAGTFLPVKAEDTRDHRMHAETGDISAEAARAITQAREQGGRVVCVGTTSLRLLESAAAPDGSLSAWSGSTSIFITPGYQFRIADLLVTNFHLPRSTLFMLVCAMAGLDTMHAAYAHAIKAGYRFYSYGDGSLLRCKDSC